MMFGLALNKPDAKQKEKLKSLPDKAYTMIKFLPLDFLGVSHRIL